MLCAACRAPCREGCERCPSCAASPLLADRFALQSVVGHGARGTLYRALDLTTRAEVAIKEKAVQPGEPAEKMSERESRVLVQLSHPGIPRYIDAFTYGRGLARRRYLVQSFVDGVSIDGELARRRYTEGEVLALVAEVADILVYLHGLSPPVIHRDIKPHNVMRRTDGRIVLVDFDAVRDTLPGTLGGETIAGTFGYMAPEHFMGEASPATDIYSLGALAVRLLSRQEPAKLQGRDRKLAWQRRIDVTPATRQLLERMLAEAPEHRPTAAEVAALARSGRQSEARPCRRAAGLSEPRVQRKPA